MSDKVSSKPSAASSSRASKPSKNRSSNGGAENNKDSKASPNSKVAEDKVEIAGGHASKTGFGDSKKLSDMARCASPSTGEVLTEPKEIRAHEKKNYKNFEEGYEALSVADQKRFDSLIDGLTPPGTKVDTTPKWGAAPPTDPEKLAANRRKVTRHGLYQLASKGILSKTDVEGVSVLDRIEKLQTQELAPGFDRNEFVQTGVGSIAHFGGTRGGVDRAAQALQKSMARNDPSGYLGTLSDLASPEGKATLDSGEVVERQGTTSDSRLMFSEATRSVAGKELLELELGASSERKRAYEALNPKQREAVDVLLESQIPKGNQVAPVPGQKMEFGNSVLKEMSRQTGEDFQKSTTRETAYKLLEDGFKADTVQELEGQIKSLSRKTDYQAPRSELFNVPVVESERAGNFPSNQARVDGIEDSMSSGRTQTVMNSEGQEFQVQISGRGDSYAVKLDGGKAVPVSFDGEFSPQEKTGALEKISDYYSQIPEHLRGHSSGIVLTNAEIYNFELDGQQLTAAGSFHERTKEIKFYSGVDNLTEQVFNHEYGHAVGYGIEEEQDTFIEKVFKKSDYENRGAPDGWKEAMQADGTSMSTYSNSNWREDFAESFVAYQEAREYGSDKVESLANRFPERAEILEDVFSNSY